MLAPNILLISLDATRADRLSCYGYGKDTTPFLSEFSRNAALVEKAYCAGCWTLPSHASLMTGAPVYRHGVGMDLTRGLKLADPRLITLPEYLRACGYSTAAFTNSGHLSRSTLMDRGFEWFRLMEELVGPTHPWYPKRLFGKYWARFLNVAYGKYQYTRKDQGGESTSRAFSEWLRHVWNRKQPFLVFIHLFDAHAPYLIPEPYRSAFGRVRPSDYTWLKENVSPWHHLTGARPLTDEQFEIMNTVYDGALLYQDDILSRLVEALEKASVFQDTMVVVIGDHGESLSEHGSFGHVGERLYEPAIRVPMVIRTPQNGSQATQKPSLGSLLDVFPTILGQLSSLGFQNNSGEWLNSQLQGYDLLNTGADVLKDRIVITESPQLPLDKIQEASPRFDVQNIPHHRLAIHWQQHKLIRTASGENLLFNLDTDTDEVVNVAEEYSELVHRIWHMWEEWREAYPSLEPFNSLDTELGSPEVINRLRALGYLG